MPTAEGCKQEVEIVIPIDEVEKETATVIANVQKRAHLPGFRPGKAPVSLIKSRFKDAIRQDVLESIVPKAFHKRAEQEDWKVVGRPNVTEVHFHDGEPLRFKAAFEVAPDFELGDYRGIEVAYSEPEVSEEDIDARVDVVRNQKAEFVNEDPRPLVEGDFAVVAIRSIEGVDGPPVESDEMSVQLGDAETMPEFSEGLRGMSPGEEKEISVAYPADYGQERLAGKTVKFHVSVKQVRRKELPELNDDFARDLGDFQTLGELREAVRKTIFSEREFAAQREAKEKILDNLVGRHEFPIPDVYIDQQLESQVERYMQDLSARGIDPRTIRLDWAKLREAGKERAIRDVKAALITDKIADAESIYASNDEVDREIQRAARQQREPVAALRMKLEKEGGLARIAGHIRTEKTLNYLFEHARKLAQAPADPPE